MAWACPCVGQGVQACLIAPGGSGARRQPHPNMFTSTAELFEEPGSKEETTNGQGEKERREPTTAAETTSQGAAGARWTADGSPPTRSASPSESSLRTGSAAARPSAKPPRLPDRWEA